ncbi:hypothetical protein D3C78_1440690 [compost metagenome]
MSEKSTTSARAGVLAKADEIMSIFFVCSDGISVAKGMPEISGVRPSSLPTAWATSTITPSS